MPSQPLEVRVFPFAAVGLAAFSSLALAEGSAGNANKSNNPLTPAPAFNIQDYYSPDLFGSDKYTNDLLLRGTLPLPPVGFVPVPQLIRATLPISTRPDPDGGYTTGLGDINLFDIFLLKTQGTQLGLGPLVTFPSASDNVLGTGNWQAGLAAVAVHPTPARLLGALVQRQHSFAGEGGRPDSNSLTFQPFGIFNFPEGWYPRSTAIWTFDLQHGRYYIPLGLGAGKLWKSDKTIFNLFAEPQRTAFHHDGEGFPHWTVFAGFNMTFSK